MPNNTAFDLPRLSFRKDIQGLRAIAVICVIFSHIGFKRFEGGYIGVDIFFVISGYVITSILIKELVAKQKINFLVFYARRFKRLLPALIVMILVSSYAASKVLPLDDLPEQASAAAAAAFWISNIYFTFHRIDYFASTATENIFLHTWSLGVEEQFYLIWPALLMILFYLNYKIGHSLKSLFSYWLFIITLVSFFACVWATYSHPNSAYYMMPFRFWQFGMGALTFLICTKAKKYFIYHSSFFLSWIGLSLILYSALIFSNLTQYPGIAALAPTIGTCLLIASVPNQSTQNRRILLSPNEWLKIRPLQFIGDISYSWYLWHWPTFILGEIYFTNYNGFGVKFLLIFISWLLAVVSYLVVEKPIRSFTYNHTKTSLYLITSASLMVLLNVCAIHWHNISQKQIINLNIFEKSKMDEDLPIIYKMGCDEWYHSEELKPCIFGDQNSKNTVLLAGDSIGAQWFPAVQRIFSKPNWKIIVLTKSSCPMVEEIFFYKRINREFTECFNWRNKLIKYINDIRPNILIIGSSDRYKFTQEEWTRGTINFIKNVEASSKNIYLIRANPKLTLNRLACIKSPTASNCSEIYDNKTSTHWRLLKGISTKNHIKTIDMNNDICPNSTCSLFNGNLMTYRDNTHLSSSFVKSLSGRLRQQLENNQDNSSTTNKLSEENESIIRH